METKQKIDSYEPELHVNHFDDQFDNCVKSIGQVDWTTFEQFILDEPIVTTDKHSVPLFNCVRYKSPEEINDPALVVEAPDGRSAPRRKQVNASAMDALVLDFDGGLTVQEAKERFKDYTYIGYTSHSHMKEVDVHKFRLVFPLASPISTDMTIRENGSIRRTGDLFQVRDALVDFAGPADPKSFEPNTMYFLPSCHPDRRATYESWRNEGVVFDWTVLPRSTISSITNSIASLDSKSPRSEKPEYRLLPDDVLMTKEGPIRVGDIDRNIDGVVCPFHNDTKGGEFVARSPAGTIFLHCKHCKTIPMESPQEKWPPADPDPEEIEYRIPPDYLLRTKTSSIRVQDVHTHVSNVVCPFHTSAVAESSALPYLGGMVRLSCNVCGEIPMDPDYDPEAVDKLNRVYRDGQWIQYPARVPDFGDLLEFETSYYDASDRTLVQEQLQKICSKILNDKVTSKESQISYPLNRSHILFMPEGSGKSLLAREMARLGKKIIFACKSWDQAFDKYDEFKSYGDDHGFSVDLFLSKDAKARRRFGVGVARGDSNDPYRIGKIDDEASIQRFKEKNPDLSEEFIRISWNFFAQDELFIRDYVAEGTRTESDSANPLWDKFNQGYFGKNADLLVTTHAQLRTISQREQYIPKDRIIWFDDPDVWDVIDIERYDPERWPDISDDDLKSMTVAINGRRYFKRDANQSLGISQRFNTCIYTTTEVVTKRAIEKMLSKRHEEFVVHDKMNHLFGGKITILGTSKVRRDFDGIVPVVSRLLEKRGYNNILIANGLATPLNHSNNKGNNKLKDNIILVELSIPHPNEIYTCYDALDIPPGSDGNEMGRLMALDRMHQAIGRNSGYRWNGCECVVLADSKYHAYLTKNVRYKIDERNSVLIDRTQRMGRKERRTSGTVSDFVAETESLILSIHELVQDARQIKPAIKHVIQQIDDPEKTIHYAARLLHSLASHADKDFWTESDPPEASGHLETRYLDLGDWLLEKCLSARQRDCVLKHYWKDYHGQD